MVKTSFNEAYCMNHYKFILQIKIDKVIQIFKKLKNIKIFKNLKNYKVKKIKSFLQFILNKKDISHLTFCHLFYCF